MKKYALLSITLASVGLSCFAMNQNNFNKNPLQPFSENLQVIPLTSLTTNQLEEIMKGQCPELAVEFSAQTQVPINFYLKGDLVTFTESDEKWGNIEIKQTVYFRCIEQELFLSSNLTDWKPLLDFITGNITVGLNIDNGHPSIFLGTETSRRL